MILSRDSVLNTINNKEGGRPGIPPGVYFRMLFVGYFEGLDGQRGIAWRCAESLALRSFPGIAITEDTPGARF